MVFTDGNRVLPAHAQAVGGAAMVRKVLHTDAPIESGATLFIFAKKTRPGAPALSATVNGEAAGIAGQRNPHPGSFAWFALEVAATVLRPGENVVTLGAPDARYGDWLLPLATTAAPGGSFASSDAGRSWTNQWLGRYSAVTGEYLIRLRIDDGASEQIPAFVHEAPDGAEFARIRAALPKRLRDGSGDSFRRARRLSTWLARTLVYVGPGTYCPWRFWDVIRANAENRQLLRRGASPAWNVMCVHFAAAYMQAALALGLRSRCMISTAAIHGGLGHFFPEVWLPERERWAIVDPTGDFVFIDGHGEPKSAVELSAQPHRVRDWLQCGPGWARHVAHLESFRASCVVTGKTYRNVGYWRRNDFLSHPELTASTHGAVTYCEPDIVWLRGGDPVLKAFPYDCRDAARTSV